MVGFPITTRPAENVPQLNGLRYNLATTEQLQGIPNVKRAWDIQPTTAQDLPIAAPFAEHFDFRNGYGFSFAPGGNGYELADGWDVSAADKLATWPKHADIEGVTDTAYRGWWYFDFASGYLYLLRGRYATKYAPDDSGAQWTILEYHTLGTAGQVVCGAPATFKGKTYVPMCTASTGALLRWYQLTTVTSAPVTEVQTVTISGTPTSGTYTLTYNDGVNSYTTSALAFNADQAAVQAALRALPGFQKVTVVTTGSTPNYTHTVTMTAVSGADGAASPAQMTNTDSTSGGTHSIANATTVAGTSDTWTRGPDNVQAGYFCTWNKPTVGPVLVRTNANSISVVSGDPMTAGNWSALQPVTDTTFNLTAIAVLGRLLYCGAPNGLFSADEAGIIVNEIPSISSALDARNFVGMREHNAALLAPHKLGLIRFRSGSAWGIVGAEEDAALEGQETQGGWGRTLGIAPYGKFAYTSINDLYNSIGAVTSLQVSRTQPRGPLTPHMHHRGSLLLEDVAVCSLKSAPPLASALLTWADDSAVGANAWSNPGNAAADDGLYASVLTTGQTHYLKGLNADAFASIPATATIRGITARIKRAAGGAAGSATFNYTGGTQTLTVPDGITAITFDVQGAEGATTGAAGGLGARVQTTLAVTPGEVLTITVGSAGTNVAGGFNGGGAPANVGGDVGGGGGATDVRQGGTASSDRVIVAGGGGGSGGGGTPGAGGGGGQNGTPGGSGSATAPPAATGGGGATGSTGGTAGAAGGGTGAVPGNAGASAAAGGAGAQGGNGNGGDGGGGGGGYAGGGSGASGGTFNSGSGGGGGSSVAGTGTSGTSFSSGYKSGNGYVAASWGGTTNVVDAVVKLVKAGSVVGSNLADTSTQWPGTVATATYGGSTNLWGTTWTVAEIQAAAFGLVLSATVTVGSALAYYAELEVAYELQGQSDAPSYLAVIRADDQGATASPVVYKLPQAGQPVANDPNVPQFVSDGALLHTARIYGPTRATPKRYSTFEVYAELTPAVSGGAVPGVRFEAQLDDSGTWYPLMDLDGQTTFTASGQLELFFPQQASVGKWLQLRVVIDAVSGLQVGMACVLRDATLRGYLLSRPGDLVQAVLVLAAGQQYADGNVEGARSERDMRNEITAMLEPNPLDPTPTIQVYDPLRRMTYPAVLQQPRFVEVTDGSPLGSTTAAILTFLRLRGPGNPS